MGMTDSEIAQPFVGVATTWNEAAPCNIALMRQAQSAKKGVNAAGGTPREFCTITVTDGIAMGHEGMKSSLVSREVIADSIETVVAGEGFDGFVAIGGCDKNMPGCAMAMARLDRQCRIIHQFGIGRFVAAGVLLASITVLLPASPSSAADVDTEHMFGFTEGSDIGTAHQPEAELETIGAFGRADGNYSAVSATASLKYPLTSSFRLAPSVTFTRFASSGVTNVDDIEQVKAERAGLEFRWRALDRTTAPVGLTFVAAPTVGFVDPLSGAAGDALGMGLIGIVDRALRRAAPRLFGAGIIGEDANDIEIGRIDEIETHRVLHATAEDEVQ